MHRTGMFRVPIRAAEDQHPELAEGLTAAEQHVAMTWLPARTQGLPAETHPTIHVPVWINHGRWVVCCPDPGCNGAELASRIDKRFFCCDCGNQASGGLWLTVDWPADADVIADLVGRRPDPKLRNWFPEETAEDIAGENLDLGVW